MAYRRSWSSCVAFRLCLQLTRTAPGALILAWVRTLYNLRDEAKEEL